MRVALLIHIVAGALGLISGVAALCAAKGETLHRRSGVLFFCSMVTMAVSGVGVAVWKGREATVIGGVLAAYLAVTGLATVRAASAGSGWLNVGAMLLGLTVGLASVAIGIEAIASGTGRRGQHPAALFLLYGTVALVASAGDIRMLRGGAPRGASRIARHLWRMGTALFIATGSFFLGAARVFPESLRIPALLAIPPALVLLAILYWLWRVRARQSQKRTLALNHIVPLLLVALLAGACSSAKEVPPWERTPWQGMSPEERDRTAVADLVKSEKFSAPSCRWLKHGTWILAWPSETHLYRAAQQAGIIEMREAGTDNRIGTPEPAWRITITEFGKEEIAGCKVSPGRNDWGVPVSRRRFVSAKYAGEGPNYSGVTYYELEYEWIPTEVGAKVKAHLTGPMAVQEGKYRTKISLKRNANAWFVDQLNDIGAVRID